MSVAAQLKQFKLKALEGVKETKEYSNENPLERAKREIQQSIASSEKYRASVLKNVSTFAGLSPEALISAANCMEEVYYKKGDKIIEQDDIGESFFVLEEGQVSVTRKANFRDHHEASKELARLGQNSHFGEISLMTAESRSATVTVISQTAKCLVMTKKKFDELLANTNQIMAENRRIIGKDVLENVSLFKNLNANNKKKLLDAMVPITFQPNSYICRQGTIGNTFYILTEGSCKVTINNGDKGENEVFRFRPGDFFGEVALIESSSRRTANVISTEVASCLSLSRADFNRLLKSLQVKIQEHNLLKFSGAAADDGPSHLSTKHFNALAKKRRISGFNTHGQRDDMRVANILKRFTRFTTEALWNSMYSRMYREMLLDPSKSIEYGKCALNVIKNNDTRLPAIQAIGEQAARILETDPPRRTVNDQLFLLGLLRQRNDLKDKLCRAWPSHQYSLLCKKAKYMRFKAFRKIIEVDHQGTCAFLILRGCVRVFGRASTTGGGKMYFEEDLFPGEVFGESALNGMHTRQITVQAVTNVELAIIEDQDFVLAQDRDSMHMGTEEKSKFLAQVPIFRNWDHYKLLRLAVALVQEEVNKGVVIVEKGAVSKDFYFLVNGRVDVLDSLEKRHIVTTLLKHDYLGESGLVNKFVKAASSKVQEEHYCVAVTKVDYLVLSEHAFGLIDIPSIEGIRRTFHEKTHWRRERLKVMKHERAKLRKYHRIMSKEYNAVFGEDIEITNFNYTQQVIPPLTLTDGTHVGGGGGMGPLMIDTVPHHSHQHHYEDDRPESPVLASILVHPNYRHNSPRLELYSSLRGHDRPSTAELKQRIMEEHANELQTHDYHLQQEYMQSQEYQMRRRRAEAVKKESTVVMSPHHATATPWGEIIPAPREKSPSPTRNLDDTASDNFIEVLDLTAMKGTKEAHHPTSANRLRATVHSAKRKPVVRREKLDDIEDIPEIFVKGNDPFMVTSTIRDAKLLETVEEAIRHGSRPKSARLLINNASRNREPGYTEELIKANKARPISADFFTSRQPKAGLTAEQIKAQKIAAMAASLSAKMMHGEEGGAHIPAVGDGSGSTLHDKSQHGEKHHDKPHDKHHDSTISKLHEHSSGTHTDSISSPKGRRSPGLRIDADVNDDDIASAVSELVAALPMDLKVGVSVGAVIGGTCNKSLRLRGSYRIPATQSYAEAAVALGIIKKFQAIIFAVDRLNPDTIMSNFIADDRTNVAFHQKTYTDTFFNINGDHGFLPSKDPLSVVPEEYAELQAVVDRMPLMVSGKNGIDNEIETSVLKIPNFHDLVLAETDVFRIQALYRAFTFVASAYCLEPVQREFVKSGNHGKARNLLPVNISKPLSVAAEKLGAFPWLDYYYAYTIGNYVKKDPQGDLHWKNQDMAVKFCGSTDEIGFNATHVFINEVTPALVDCVYRVAEGDEIKYNLKRCGEIVKEINVRRKDMWQASASEKFNEFRNFLMGVTGNEALFGSGVVFDTCYNQEPQEFRGASGAQDSIIPMLDIFTGIVDYYPTNELTKYLMDLRVYRPKCLQHFLVDLRTFYEENPLFASLVANKQYEELVYFLRVIDEIYLFRNGHWQFVQKYIMANTKHDRGTGGTPVTSWLMNQIRSVLNFYEKILAELSQHVDALVDPDVLEVYQALAKSFAHKQRLLNTQTDLLKGGLANLDMVKMHRSNSLDDESSEGLRMLCPHQSGSTTSASSGGDSQKSSGSGGCPYHHPRTETI